MPLYYNETIKKEQAPVSVPVPFYDLQCLRQPVPAAFPLKKGSMLLQYFRRDAAADKACANISNQAK